MKRFITYLYEYEEGHKTKNTGFIRVDIRNDIVNMEVCVRNCIRMNDKGCVYGLIQLDKLFGIALGEIKIQRGQNDNRISIEKDNIGNSGYSIEDFVGVAICFEDGGYLASCWKDDSAEEIASGDFLPYQILGNEAKTDCGVEDMMILKKQDEISVEEENLQEIPIAQEISKEKNIEKYITYKKIEIDQIRELPSRNWHLCNNSFLMHGVFNYGYLILKKIVDNEKEIYMLGVPGFFEKAEMVMAVFFGFSEFEPIAKKVVDMEMNIESIPFNIEKNQQPKNGLFGGWFVKLEE